MIQISNKSVDASSTDEASDIDIPSKPRSYLERRRVISSAQNYCLFDESSLSLMKEIENLELADDSRARSKPAIVRNIGVGETIGGFIKFLAGKHNSRKALKAFTKANLDFEGDRSKIINVGEIYTKRDDLYLDNYKNLSELLNDEKYLVTTKHRRLELEHLLKEMTRKDTTYYHAHIRLISHPFILPPYEIIESISEIVEIFDVLDEKIIGRVERANISYLKERFLRDFARFENWTNKIKAEKPLASILNAIDENVKIDILLLLRTLKDSVSNYLPKLVSRNNLFHLFQKSVNLLSSYCNHFPDLLLLLYNFEVEQKYGSIKLWKNNLDTFSPCERQVLGNGEQIDYK